MAKVLVIGSRGQLGRSLAERGAGQPGLDFKFVHRPEADLEREQSLAAVIGAEAPDVIINAAAYTAVDRAEAEADLAEQINSRAPAVMAREAARIGARLIHISTDYVFDGQNAHPYSEDAPVDPINMYGKTKLGGEEAVRAEHPYGHLIVRTSWVYSPFGANFVKTMLRLAESRSVVNVVSDQIGTPTSALHLADGLIAAISGWQEEPELGLGETFHLAGTGETSWAELAQYVMEESRACGGPAAQILPITTSEYPTPARRPSYSILDSGKFRAVFGYACPPWREGVRDVVKRLLEPEPEPSLQTP